MSDSDEDIDLIQQTEKKQKVIIKLSFYKKRLNKLVCGYNRKIINTPNDISLCILAYAQTTDQLFFNKISASRKAFSDVGMIGEEWRDVQRFEIYLNEFTAKVIDYSNNIHKYKIQYKTGTFHTNQIGKQGLAFIETQIKSSPSVNIINYSFQAEAINNANVSIMKSGWITTQVRRSWTFSARGWVAHEFFARNIDKKGKGFINIKEWIDILNEIEGFNELNDWEMKRIFYFIMYLKDVEQNMIFIDLMEKKDFYGFLLFNVDTYCGLYQKFINILKDKEPDLMDGLIGWLQ